jgi:spermidine synthase
MRPFETLDRVTTPEGRVLSLHHHDGHYFIHLDGEELMSTWVHGSEVALAELACAGLENVPKPRVLIGGLGLGFTLRAALEVLPDRAGVIVAELFPRVVEWNRVHLTQLGRPLEDRRVRIHDGDVGELLRNCPEGAFHAVMLDVDNGPSEWCLESNGALYDRAGLQSIKRAIAPGGTLAVWSAYPDPTFVKTLRKGGFEASSRNLRGRGRKGPRHTIFLGRVPA